MSDKIDDKLKKTSKNTFKAFDNTINKFILLLRKSAYPYEYIDKWKKFNETSLPRKRRILYQFEQGRILEFYTCKKSL